MPIRPLASTDTAAAGTPSEAPSCETAPGASLDAVTAPSASIPPLIAPEGTLPALSARTAYGVAVNNCRGESACSTLAPLVPARTSNQRSPPSKDAAPKFSVTLNRPLLTATAELMTGPAIGTAAAGELNSEKLRS